MTGEVGEGAGWLGQRKKAAFKTAGRTQEMDGRESPAGSLGVWESGRWMLV